MNNYKNKLIDQHIIPFFSGDMPLKHQLTQDLYGICTLHQVMARQYLELPGSSDDGKAWFSISSTVHSFYYCGGDKRKVRGRQIWKKLQFALDHESLQDGTIRTDTLQALEPGEFLSISYPDLRRLIADYEEVRLKMDTLGRMQERYYSKHIKLLTEPPLERVKQLAADNPIFMKCSSQEIQAMHCNMSLRSYTDYLRMNR